MSFQCPKCGFRDSSCWHYPTFHGSEMPYARIDELELENKELAFAIRNAQPIRKDVLEYIQQPYAYKFNIKSGFVRRRSFELWKAFQWQKPPMEKPKTRARGKQHVLFEKSSTTAKECPK